MDKLEAHLKPIYQRIANHPERQDGFNAFVKSIRRVIELTKQEVSNENIRTSL